MTNDASLPPNVALMSGLPSQIERSGHVEVDVSVPSSSSSPSPQTHRYPTTIAVSATTKCGKYLGSHQPNTEGMGTSLREVCADLHARLSAFLAAETSDELTRSTQARTRVAIEVIEKALRDYDFYSLSLSYNGGKDCLVLLIIYLSVLHTHFTQPIGRRKQGNTTDTSEGLCSENREDTNTDSFFPSKIPSIYAKPPDPFPAVTSFVEESSRAYHLDLVHISTNPKPRSSPTVSAPALSEFIDQPSSTVESEEPHLSTLRTTPTAARNKKISFRDAFAQYLALPRFSEHPIKAIFVGTRLTDPYSSHLEHFTYTDGNWPAFMRIQPVLHFRLSEIWCFLRSPFLAPSWTPALSDSTNSNHTSPVSEAILNGLPPHTEPADVLSYCRMYDEGYTSLGGITDTVRNPRLRYTDPETGRERYYPAYMMGEDDEERLGREGGGAKAKN